MSNKAIILQAGGGYDKVTLGSRAAAEPKAGEITVRLHANSLNYHDFAVVSGMWGPSEARIPMADGAGVVTAVGDGVSEFKLGDHVVSTFFPTWLAGEPLVEGFATTPGDGVDGYAREIVTASTNAFTLAPKGWSHVESSTLTTAALTAWRAMMGDDALKPGDTVLVQGTGGVSIFALQFAKMAGATGKPFSSSTKAATPKKSISTTPQVELLMANEPTMQNNKIVGINKLRETRKILVATRTVNHPSGIMMMLARMNTRKIA